VVVLGGTYSENVVVNKSVTLTGEDAAGNQATDTMVVTVNPTEVFPMWAVAAVGIVAVGIVIAAVIFWKRRK
jgi:nitrous oxidase accessory protein NosD